MIPLVKRKQVLKSLTGLSLLSVVVFLQGCTQQRHAVLALTTTIIGLEVSQNPATQVPQGKLGYNRGELAFVPTNRSAKDQAGNTAGGAQDSADVLMELRYGGIFDKGASSGIYQRLAVGKTAVQQDGAAAMFIRDAEGEVDADAKDALKAALSPKQLTEAEERAVTKVRIDDAKIVLILEKVAPEGTLDKTKLESALSKAEGVSRNIKDMLKESETADKLKERLEVLYNSALNPLFKALYDSNS